MSSLEPYVRRADFSRWIADVLGDHVLATELRTLEEQHRVAARAETVPEMVAAIRGRYDLVDDDIPVPVRWIFGTGAEIRRLRAAFRSLWGEAGRRPAGCWT